MIFTRQQKIGLFGWLAAILIAATIMALRDAGLRINETPSLPVGLWWASKLELPLKHGAIVSFCPPRTEVFKVAYARGYINRGRCPSGFEPLMKPVPAIEGDIVVVEEAGISINGERLKNSAALQNDSAGRTMEPITPGEYRIAKGQVWLVSTFDARSFDSRYFGSIGLDELVDCVHAGNTAVK